MKNYDPAMSFGPDANANPTVSTYDLQLKTYNYRYRPAACAG